MPPPSSSQSPTPTQSQPQSRPLSQPQSSIQPLPADNPPSQELSMNPPSMSKPHTSGSSGSQPTHSIPQNKFYHSILDHRKVDAPVVQPKPIQESPERHQSSSSAQQPPPHHSSSDPNLQINSLDQFQRHHSKPIGSNIFEDLNKFYGISVPANNNNIHHDNNFITGPLSPPNPRPNFDLSNPPTDEITTNIMPNPFENDDETATVNPINDFDELNHINRRRRKRNVDSVLSSHHSFAIPRPLHPITSTRSISQDPLPYRGQSTRRPNTFGYPAINILTDRKKRSLGSLLLPTRLVV